MGDVIGASALALVALALLVWGIRKHLAETPAESVPPSSALGEDSVDADWTDADRYHGSRQWGR